MVKEEGHYTIKRVDRLPIVGNSNWLYIIKSNVIDKFYRWLPNGTYEEISLGGLSSYIINADEITETATRVFLTPEEKALIGSGSSSSNKLPQTIATQGQTAILIPGGSDNFDIYIKRVFQLEGIDYNITPTGATMTYPLDEGDIITVRTFKNN